MYDWFECKVRYEKSQEDNHIAKVQETYLVDAMSFTEAESRIVLEMKVRSRGELEVTDIKKLKVAELIELRPGEDDRWYKSKLVFTIVDEKTGKEKHASNTVIVRAASLKKAIQSIEEGMRGTVDYTIASVIETTIVDVFHYAEIRKKE